MAKNAATEAQSINFELQKNERDPTHPLSVNAGFDDLVQIGEPQGANQRNATIEAIFAEQCSSKLKRVEENHNVAGPQKMNDHMEEKVDKMRIQKDQELEDYKKEILRAKRYEQSKLLQQQDPNYDSKAKKRKWAKTDMPNLQILHQ